MTLAGLRTGDHIEVDKKGRRFYAIVRNCEDRTVSFMPITNGISYRTCSSHEVVGIWKATKDTRRAKGLE